MITLLRPMCRRLSTARISQPKVTKRSFSATSSSFSTPPPSNFSAFGALASEFDKLSPGFAISPDKISILQTPSEFYSLLKVEWYSQAFLPSTKSISQKSCTLKKQSISQLYISASKK
jgi:hypothetical protein